MSEFRAVYVAHDYEAITGFFIEVMALEVVDVFEQWDEGIVLRAGDGLIEIFVPGDEQPGPVSSGWLAWEVADADAEYERLEAAGADLAQRPMLHPWGHKSFRVNGPDGWRVTLYEIVSPAQNGAG